MKVKNDDVCDRIFKRFVKEDICVNSMSVDATILSMSITTEEISIAIRFNCGIEECLKIDVEATTPGELSRIVNAIYFEHTVDCVVYFKDREILPLIHKG